MILQSALGLVLLSGSALAGSKAPAHPQPVFHAEATIQPDSHLLRGQEAVDFLNKRPLVQAVATNGTLSISQLKETLRKDPDFAIDVVNSKPLYTCQGLIPPSNASIKVQGISASGPMMPPNTPKNAQGLPLLSSRPTSKKTILLDFDGCTITKTWWNTGRAPTIVTLPFDPAKDGVKFNAIEQEYVYGIWRAVAEDYAVFDVDVTTIDRGIDRIIKNFPGDEQVGTRLCIGGSSLDWYKKSAAGVSYLNTFGLAVDTPGFVFASSLENRPKWIWESASHEVGHTLGLSHDGDNKGPLYYGYDIDNWAPIMGVAHSREWSTFDRGTYAYASNPEDDFAVIGKYLKQIPDTEGNSQATATLLKSNVPVSGILNIGDNADVFKINAVKGTRVEIRANTVSPWQTYNQANLDLTLMISNINLGLISPKDSFSASAVFVAPVTGIYYVTVGRTEMVTKYGPNHSYGSVGTYTLAAKY